MKNFDKLKSKRRDVKAPPEMNGTSRPGSSSLKKKIGKKLGVPTGEIEKWRYMLENMDDEELPCKNKPLETEEDMLEAEVARLKIDGQAYRCHQQSAIPSMAFVDVKPSAISISESDSPDVNEVILNLKQDESLETKLDRLKAEVARLTRDNEAYRRQRQKTEDEASKAFKDIKSSDIVAAETKGEGIAKGGFSIVYKYQLDDRQVAVKVPREVNVDREERAFKDEVQALRGICHPNIVIPHGACLEKCALVYEYLPNGTLAERLKQGQGNDTFPWKERVQVAASISLALVYLHDSLPHPITHGDLKPDNILFDAENKCKLGDFGISRFMQHNTTGGRPCHNTDEPKGTPWFMDPDFHDGYKKLTCLADQFAFGIVLLQLVSGRYNPTNLRKSVSKLMKRFDRNSKNKTIRLLSDNKLMDTTWSSNGKSKQTALSMLALGLRCSAKNGKDRPDFKTKVWTKIQSLACEEVPQSDPDPSTATATPEILTGGVQGISGTTDVIADNVGHAVLE